MVTIFPASRDSPTWRAGAYCFMLLAKLCLPRPLMSCGDRDLSLRSGFQKEEISERILLNPFSTRTPSG